MTLPGRRRTGPKVPRMTGSLAAGPALAEGGAIAKTLTGQQKTSRFKEACRKALSPARRYVSIDDGALKLDSERLAVLTDLVEAGHVKPVIDRCCPLEKIAEAHRYVGEGHRKGGVAITI